MVANKILSAALALLLLVLGSGWISLPAQAAQDPISILNSPICKTKEVTCPIP